MIERILPAAVIAVEAYDDPPDAVLFPEEEQVIAKSVEKRRREFTTARHCARLALARLGLPPAPILPGERGAPGWPDGVVGSMTHCAGYRAAVLARDTDIVTVGIDAEPHQPLPDGVEKVVTRPEERVHLAELAAADPAVHWDKLLFAAKESVYKAWFPLTHKWLGFDDARITIGPAGTFEAELMVPGPVIESGTLAGFSGRWLVDRGLVVTAISLPVGN
ncbi:4'-phosphopantetheinyl transferase EntD (siderophore biosynthesis) [Actinokineospora alba]|uniref:4'-phosphopantetheinyl transferase EntD (Siderophore biosynthesis) n=1 Tax=Actinokineospora alba TaxID=504798 RepID=A0A1H0M2F1_9PSEU|nr:4'-phosphopantetheinyl transferase superfamily protein [Actinokineospora alba]TDP67557.1 4'-phosphopantetheinyl transferase EntD [Actinokineospora alba]SDI45754.1 4'-phosphopantetheinyl transferase EntD (siderophore biosynthesis) [Actinokineospora alba]SDO74471.1 4'-phosphopantetheinyl transferase EntD (siderophore biosynthesis) [Actinokineospora alba]